MGRYTDFFAVLVTGALLYAIKRRRKPSLPLPPGPKGLPLVGNLFQIPSELQWIKYHEWSTELNTDILHLQAAGTHIIVLDKYEVAVDLLESRSSMYSGRPRLVMITELMGQDFSLAFMNYGERWRKHRRLAQQSLQATAFKRYRPHLAQATRKLLKRLLDDRDDGKSIPHFRQLAAETIMSVAYGIQIQQENDPYVKLAEDANQGTNLQKIEAGEQDNALTEDVLRNTLAVLYAGGSDTSVSTMASCILGLLEHPEVLKKAQVQIDSVVKPGHLPDLDDEPSLPYITAIVKEALRWREVTPFGGLHTLSTDDEYKGYHLPAGAIVIANVWAMLHDKNVYADPFEFNPDRFINLETGKVDYSRARDPELVCFGFGRRICPGRFMAFESLWLLIASLIATFDIEKAKEKVHYAPRVGFKQPVRRIQPVRQVTSGDPKKRKLGYDRIEIPRTIASSFPLADG
ncbi:hypothetical protein H1R20_g6807, partial [Candolleomyces eurysporus]